MKGIKKEIFEDTLTCPECKGEFFGEGGIVDGIQYCGKCFPIKKAASKKVCEGCGKEFPQGQMKKHDGLLYCKACFDEISPSKSPGKKKDRDSASANMFPTSLAVTIDAPALVEAIGRTIARAVPNPFRVEFAPLKLELASGGTIAMPVQVPVPVNEPIMAQAPAPNAPNESPARPPIPIMTPVPDKSLHAPSTRHVHGRPYIESAILRIMGAKRRKWRPVELVAELQLLDQPVDVTGEDVARVLERLARPAEGAAPEEQVVQLSTRYMRRDLFIVEDEVDFIDLLILKVLAATGPGGAPATAIHAAAELCNLVPAALPTVLNHLRALKAPGWELVEKAGTGMRDHYKITTKGTGLLADAEDAALGGFTGEWRERLVRMGVFTAQNALSDKGDLLVANIREVIVQHATKADKALIVAYMEKQLDPALARAHSRKVAALKILGF
ncbi:MAG: LIM domain-containing protein [Candidatus Sigynarchaeota archaeon]